MLIDDTGQEEGLSRREREKLQHRQEILDAAVKVFAKKGFHNATLDEVAQEAEFSKGALYLYFTSKEDILQSIIMTSFIWWWEFIQEALSGEHTFREELTTLFKGLAKKAFEQPDYFSVISSQHATMFKAIGEERRAEFHDTAMKHWNFLNTRVEIAIARGELKNVPPLAIAGLVHGSMDGIINNRWQCSTEEDLMHAIDNFIEIIFSGLQP